MYTKVFHIILHTYILFILFSVSFAMFAFKSISIAIYLRLADHATFVHFVCNLLAIILHPLESIKLKGKCISNYMYRLRAQQQQKKNTYTHTHTNNKFQNLLRYEAWGMGHGQSLGQSRNRNEFVSLHSVFSICNQTIFHPSVKCVILH